MPPSAEVNACSNAEVAARPGAAVATSSAHARPIIAILDPFLNLFNPTPQFCRCRYHDTTGGASRELDAPPGPGFPHGGPAGASPPRGSSIHRRYRIDLASHMQGGWIGDRRGQAGTE